MSFQKISWSTGEGSPIRLSKRDASALLSLRKSAYASSLKEIMLSALDVSIEDYEGQVADESRRERVNAVRDLVSTLLEGKVEAS